MSTAGRTSRRRFLLVSLITAPCLWAPSTMAWDRGMAANVAVGILGGVAMAKLIAEGARRLHDMGQSGWRGAVVLIGLTALATAVAVCSFRLSGAVTMLVLAVLAAIAVRLMLRPGQRAPNRYGEPPLVWWQTTSPAPATAVALAGAAASVLTGAVIGYGVTWLGRGMTVSNASPPAVGAVVPRPAEGP